MTLIQRHGNHQEHLNFSKMKRILVTLIILFKQHSGLYAQPTQVIDMYNTSNLPLSVYQALNEFDLILLGEIHGTHEFPKFVGDLVKLFSKNNDSIILALEIPETDQPLIDTFLLSGSSFILKRMHLFKMTKDGRSSKAMAKLIKSLHGNKRVNILCYEPAIYRSSQERDSLMSNNIVRSLKNNSRHKIILLGGNIHTLLKIGYEGNSGFKPMGYFLKMNLHLISKKLISLDMAYVNGKAWNCMNNLCQIRKLPEWREYLSYSNAPKFMVLDNTSAEFTGYSGIVCVKYVTPSKPFY